MKKARKLPDPFLPKKGRGRQPQGQTSVAKVTPFEKTSFHGINALGMEIQKLVELLEQHNLTELQVETQGQRIHLRREPAGPTIALTSGMVVPSQEIAVGTPAIPASMQTNGFITVTSPIVGTFYRSPSPEADPYVEEGDFVKKGQVLCVVEAMKLMNEIESETDGRVVKVLAESTKPVEYGQPLFLIDPAPAA